MLFFAIFSIFFLLFFFDELGSFNQNLLTLSLNLQSSTRIAEVQREILIHIWPNPQSFSGISFRVKCLFHR